MTRRLAAVVAAVTLLLARPRAARADDDITYEYENYRESGGRISVVSQGAVVEQDIGTDTHIKVGGVMDSIAGATPTGQPAPAGSDQVVLSELNDYRKAWNGTLTQDFTDFTISAGFARSLEHDYVSNGWSVNTLTDFNQKNTTLLVGAAGTDDNVEVFFLPEWLMKHTNDVLIGVTQLLDPLTSVSFNLTWDHSTGELNEPYKLVQKDIQIIPGIVLPETFAENRPNERNKVIPLLSIDHAFPAVGGSVEGSYRFYRDTYGITAHTFEADWFQHLGSRFILQPYGRYYLQSAADFYYYDLDDTSITPTRVPNPNGVHYSSDARLSALQSTAAGLKAVWTVADWLRLTAGIENYAQRGTDGVTPQSAYYRATISTAQVRVSW